MDQTEQKKQAWLTALRMLAATPKSRKDLEKKLSQKGYPAELVTEVLDRLESQNILNDRAYAANLISRYQAGKPSGRKRIEFELKRRGVAGPMREELLSEITEESERQRAFELAEDKWRRFGALDRDKRKKKVYDFLCRRGFDFTTARDCISQLEKTDSTQD